MWRITEQVSAILDAIPCCQGVVHDDKPPPDLCWVSIEMQSFWGCQGSAFHVGLAQSEKQSFFKPGNVREVSIRVYNIIINRTESIQNQKCILSIVGKREKTNISYKTSNNHVLCIQYVYQGYYCSMWGWKILSTQERLYNLCNLLSLFNLCCSFFFCYDLFFCLNSEYSACLYHLCPMWERHVVIRMQSLTVIRILLTSF